MKDALIVKAIDYIKRHLAEELTVEEIAKHCNFSKYYFNRLFRAQVGESVYAFIKRLRIEKSASRMLYERVSSITEIACDVGYSSSNFATAFKQRYRLSPVRWKKEQEGQRLVQNDWGYVADLRKRDVEYYASRMRCEVIEGFEVVYKRFITDYHNLQGCWQEFCALVSGYEEPGSRYIEISYDDPIFTEPDRCISDLCMSDVSGDVEGCARMKIAGGRYLVYDFEGSARDIFASFQGIFRIYLKHSSYQLDLERRKMFSSYRCADCEHDFFSMEIFIPVQ